MVISTLFFAIQDVLTKQLTLTVPVWQIVSVRFFFFSIFAIIFAWHSIGIRAGFQSQRPFLQIFRGLLIVTEIALFGYAIKFLGLAELHTIFACLPLIITALSGPMLGEKVGFRRWIAVAVGFAGTILILQPATGEFNAYALLALLCALMLSIYTLLTRKLSRFDSLETSLLYFGVAGFSCSLLVTPFIWQPLQSDQIILLLLLSASAIIGHASLIQALQLTPAVILQPFNYLLLVWAVIFGYIFFSEVLDSLTLVGAGIVVVSGLYVAYREIVLLRSQRSPKPR